jgi:hypothetical protein
VASWFLAVPIKNSIDPRESFVHKVQAVAERVWASGGLAEPILEDRQNRKKGLSATAFTEMSREARRIVPKRGREAEKRGEVGLLHFVATC